MSLLIEEFILPKAPDDVPLDLTLCAKRYCPAELSEGKQKVALILTPNIAAHCETWQTTVERLFEIQHVSKRKTKVVVSEAWALEYPHHGRPAILNEHSLVTLNARPDGHWFARAMARFMDSGLVKADKIIPVEYSASTGVVILATEGMDLQNIPMLILVEPPLMTLEVLTNFMKSGGNTQLKLLMASVERKRDIWPSREDARHWLSLRPPWKDWEPRVLDHFVEFALRDLPTATYPDIHSGVTLCCTREQEVVTYTYYQDALDAIDRVTELCAVLPVHCIFGAKNDLIAAETQKAFLDPSSGRKMASITRIPGAGHLVVQEQPFQVAECLYAIFNPEDHSMCKL